MTSLSLSRADRSDERPVHPPGRGSRRWLLRRALAGVLAFVVVERFVSTGIVHGPLAFAVPVLLILAMPVADSLSRRIALNGTLLLGWAPVLWWVRWPIGVNHAAVICGAAAAGLCVWLLGGPGPRARAARLVPTIARGDSIILLAAVWAWVMMHNWALAATPQRALTLLLPGYDNAAHFDMFAMVRVHSAVVGTLAAAPDGSSWEYAQYPQGYHSLLATVAELSSPTPTPGIEQLTTFTHSVATLVVFGCVVLAAAVCSLPGLHRRPLVALPVVGMTCAALVWEPGAKILQNGFGNFWLAAVAASCALVVSLSPPRRLAVPESAAVAGALVVVADTWMPLILMAAPAVLALLVRDSDKRLADEGRRLVAVGVLFVVAAAGVLACLVPLLATVTPGLIVTAWGGINGTSPTPVLIFAVVAIYVCLASPGLMRRTAGGPGLAVTARRARVLVLSPTLGILSAGVLMAAQLRATGSTSYYFVKYVMGVELIAVALVAAIGGVLCAAAVRPARGRVVATVVSLLVAAAATQTVGHVPSRDVALLHPPSRAGTDGQGPYTFGAAAQDIVDAADATGRDVAFRRVYLSLGRGRGFQAIVPDIWFHAITGTMTHRSISRGGGLVTHVSTERDAVAVVRRVLADHPEVEVVVSPSLVGSLRRAIDDPTITARLVGWQSSVEAEGEG